MSRITKNKLALLALAGLGVFASGPVLAGMTVDSNGGLEVFELDNESYWFKIGGRLDLDQVWYDAPDTSSLPFPVNFPSGADIRTALVTLRGGVGHNWVYKLDYYFNDRPGRSIGVSSFGEAFLAYSPCESLWFAVGQVGVPFGLENWASGADRAFMENSLATNAFAPDNGLGLYAEWHGNVFTAAAVLYHPEAGHIELGDRIIPNPTSDPRGVFSGTPGSDPLGFAARVTFSPIHDDFTVLHAGLSGRYENFHDRAALYDYATGLELRNRQSPILATNVPPGTAHDSQVWGTELAYRAGPFIVQGEYIWAGIDRDDFFPAGDPRLPAGDQDYHGYYVSASYVLTGEVKAYNFDSGTFGRVTPKCRNGAWEILGRYGYVKLLDDPTFATQERAVDNVLVANVHSTTLGLNWWYNDNIRFEANYVNMTVPASDDMNALGLRAQVIW